MRLSRPAVCLPWGLAFFGALLAQSEARALSCSFGISNISFGTLDGLAGSRPSTSGTLSISCAGGLPYQTIRVCPSIGPGSKGGSAISRSLSASSPDLTYQLYSDASFQTVWGSLFAGGFGTPPTIDLALGVSGSGALNVPIYARILSSAGVTPGAYLSQFGGTATTFFYAPLVNIGGCTGITVLAPTANPTFSIDATLSPSCRVTTQDLDFGATATTAQSIDAESRLAVTCTQATPYTVALSPGASGATPTTRRLATPGASLLYGLYRDASRTLPWGWSASDTLAGVGSGMQQNLTVYGRVPAQPTPAIGSYADQIVVTVTY